MKLRKYYVIYQCEDDPNGFVKTFDSLGEAFADIDEFYEMCDEFPMLCSTAIFESHTLREIEG